MFSPQKADWSLFIVKMRRLTVVGEWVEADGWARAYYRAKCPHCGIMAYYDHRPTGSETFHTCGLCREQYWIEFENYREAMLRLYPDMQDSWLVKRLKECMNGSARTNL